MHEFPPSDEHILNGILVHSLGPFFRGKPRDFWSWCQVERLRFKAIPVEEGWIRIVVEEGEHVASLLVDETRDLFGVMRVYRYVVIMQIIMPEAWVGNGSVLWDKGTYNLLVPC